MTTGWLRRARVWVAIAVLAGTVPGEARAWQAAPSVSVSGEVRTPLTLTAADLKGLPRTQVEAKDHDGRVVRYDGVLVGEILTRAGAATGAELRGAALTTYVLATASDAYQVVFSLAELDPALSGSRIVLADTADGKPLAGNQGPFRLVSPGDTRPARSIRMLQRLEVVRLKK